MEYGDLKILLIDDQECFLESWRNILNYFGLSHIDAASLEDEVLKLASNNKYDVIISDTKNSANKSLWIPVVKRIINEGFDGYLICTSSGDSLKTWIEYGINPSLYVGKDLNMINTKKKLEEYATSILKKTI